jgi:uncharacterized protein YkwD
VYEVELINRARANPSAEAARFGIALNEGLPAGTISTAPKQPLAINRFITDGARKHSQWMIDNNLFQHEGVNGTDPGQRMTNAGYAFVQPYTWGENIAYRSQKPSVPDPFTTAGQLHQDLFVDAGIEHRGHRTNMMSNSFKEIGAGIVSGEFNTFNAVMLTTDFGASGAGSFVTGVAYNDTVNANNFYTPGEGIAGLTITAKRIGDGASFTTTTFPGSGAYALKLTTAGDYIVTATGAGLSAPLRFANVFLGSINVKRDFRPADAGIIRGNVFNDANHNGAYDGGEGTPNVLVYIDSHRDGRRNNAELYSRTNADGAYRFTGLGPGVYRVRETLPDATVLTTPSAGYYDVLLGAGRIVGGKSFANNTAARVSSRVWALSSAAPTQVKSNPSDRVIDGLV